MRFAVAIFAVAVLVRGLLLASWVVPHAYVVAPYHVEVEAVARSLASGRGYSDPYLVPTGPTAHPLPIQTGLQALLYLLFGATPTAAYVRALAGIVACAASFAMLPWLAERVGVGRRAGFAGGIAAAVVPWQGLGDALGWWWNEAHAAIALGVLVALYVRRWRAPHRVSITASLGLGAFAGFAFHLAPALLPVVVGCAVFELWWVKDGRKWGWALSIVAGAALTCAPWAWRNYTAFHEMVFIRSNFGLELRLDNHDGARADLWSAGAAGLHPGNSLAEARRVQSLGEIVYMRGARDEAVDWIRSHPVRFLALTGARVWHVWFGPPGRPLEALPVAALTVLALLGLARVFARLDLPGRAGLVIPLVAYPLVFYLVGYIPRYTFPVSGILLVLAGASVTATASHQAERTAVS